MFPSTKEYFRLVKINDIITGVDKDDEVSIGRLNKVCLKPYPDVNTRMYIICINELDSQKSETIIITSPVQSWSKYNDLIKVTTQNTIYTFQKI